MTNGWQETTLSAVAEMLSGGTPAKSNPTYWQGTIPWVSAKDLKETRLADAKDHISEMGLRDGSQTAPAGSTLILVRGMTLLNDVPVVHVVRDVAFNQDIKAVVPTRRIGGEFLHYSLLAAKPRLKDAVDLAGHGTGRLPTDILKSLPVRLPSLEMQRAIAHILGTLDDKIELNRKMNETLEEMARAVFKSWFIDFDPVHRNIARRTGQSQPSSPALLPEGEGGRGPHCRGGYEFAGLAETARALRKKQTPAEGIMWELLRDRRFMGLKFRRQHQFGDYVADFYCHERSLVIELDGSVHQNPAQVSKDAKRDAYMKSQGLSVLRLPNERVFDEPEAVLNEIATHVSGSSPAGRGRGEGGVGDLPHDLDALFPDALVDSPLGKIPKGWEVKPVSDLADVVGGSTPRTDEPLFWIGGHHCWATPKDLAVLDVAVLLDTERKVTDAGIEQVSSGLLPVGTLLLSSRAPIGYLAIAETPVAINQGFIAMLPKDAVSNLFLLDWTRHSHEEIVGRANGTTFLEISKSNFRPVPVVTPPTDTMKAFDQRVRPIYNRVVANTRQSRTLAAIRDALLPKLMSGKVRVALARNDQEGRD